MLISKALQLGFSNSVGQLFKESVADDVGGSLGKAFDVKPFVSLHKLEVDPVTLRKTFERFTSIPSCLVLEVHGFEKHELFFPFEDLGVVSIKEVTVAPFAGKHFRRLKLINVDVECDVGDGLELHDILGNNLLGFFVECLQIEPLELAIVTIPNGGKVDHYGGGVVQLALIGTLYSAVELLEGVVVALCDAIEGHQANGDEKEYSFH